MISFNYCLQLDIQIHIFPKFLRFLVNLSYLLLELYQGGFYNYHHFEALF